MPTTGKDKNAAVLIRCQCGNELKLEPVISGSATYEWIVITGPMSFKCLECLKQIDICSCHALDLRYPDRDNKICTPA